MRLDAIDLRILDALTKDGRLSIRELAEKVGLSPTPCQRRVKKLQDSGVITGYSAKINVAKLGYEMVVFVFVTLEKQTDAALKTFDEMVMGFEGVTDCYVMSGDSDYMLRVVTRNLDTLQDFLKTKITSVPGVASVRSALVLQQVLHRDTPVLTAPAR